MSVYVLELYSVVELNCYGTYMVLWPFTNDGFGLRILTSLIRSQAKDI